MKSFTACGDGGKVILSVCCWLFVASFFSPTWAEEAITVSAPAIPEQPSAFIWYPGMEPDEKTIPDQWFVSNFAIERQSFRTAWSRQAARINDGALELLLMPSHDDHNKDFIGAEVQSKQKVHYGRYEVIMTAARGEGVISSFFTYTGPYFEDPHDEIDFEFLGRDTTKVWLNRFTDGKSLPGEWLDLGFDAADEMHLYTFEWLPDEIVWYVDGAEMLRVSGQEKVLPSTPGKLYINIWGGGEGQKKWSGAAPLDTKTMARYECLSYRPVGSDAPQCSDRYLSE